jgi:hypothetical protein
MHTIWWFLKGIIVVWILEVVGSDPKYQMIPVAVVVVEG